MGYAIKSILHNKAKTLLHMETEPGLGCTEPATLGLCAAAAASLLAERKIDAMAVTVQPELIQKMPWASSSPHPVEKTGYCWHRLSAPSREIRKTAWKFFQPFRTAGLKS